MSRRNLFLPVEVKSRAKSRRRRDLDLSSDDELPKWFLPPRQVAEEEESESDIGTRSQIFEPPLNSVECLMYCYIQFVMQFKFSTFVFSK